MDYIQEELLRQQKALARLLGGASDRSETADDTDGTSMRKLPVSRREMTGMETAPVPEAAHETAGLTRRSGAAGEKALTNRAAVRFRQDAEDLPKAPEALPQEEEFPSTGSTPHGAEAYPGNAILSGPANGGWTAEAADRPETWQTAKSVIQEQTVLEVWETGSGSALGPEALSRAFQRDARRYDGGFAPY